ncbi:hypothetical protein BH20ACT7_BH20ACT7_15540 [soil metagenome]
MTRVWVDFNSLDGEGLYPTLQKFASSPVSIGERVVAFDYDGNEAAARVAAVDGGVVRLQVDLGTFREALQLVETSRPNS